MSAGSVSWAGREISVMSRLRILRRLGKRFGRPRPVHLAFVALATYVLAVLVTSAWVRAALWDDLALEGAIYDNSWILQLPWRAANGDWIGRDFAYPLGPLFQLLSFIGSGFEFHSPQRTVAGMELVFPLAALAMAAWIISANLANARSRLMAAVMFASFVLYSPTDSLRYMFSLLLVAIFATGEAKEHGVDSFRDPGLWSWAIAVAIVAEAQVFISIDRGVMGLIALFVMGAYGVLARWGGGLSKKGVMRRIAAVVLALIVLQFVVAAAMAALGASYLGYLADSFALSRGYAIGMSMPFHEVKGEGVMAIATMGAVGVAVFSVPRYRDLHAGALLVGAMPLLVTALVRSDAGHVWQGIVPVAAALGLVGLKCLERGYLGRTLLCCLPPLVMVLGWYGTAESLIRNRLLFYDAYRVATHQVEPQLGYETDLTRITRWARERVEREHVSCIGFYQGADVVHALADVHGPTETMLRWSPTLQHELAEEIRRQRCPYFVQQLPAFVFGAQNWFMGEDFLAVAELYEPVERLGAAVFAMRLRSQPLPAEVHLARSSAIGVAHEMTIPGEIVVVFDEPLQENDVLRVDYTLLAPEWARFSGAAPYAELEYSRSDDGPWVTSTMALDLNRRTTQIIAVHSWAAEWRWYARQYVSQREADHLRLRLMPLKDWGPHSATLTLHRIEILRPGAAVASQPVGPSIRAGNLVELLEEGAGYSLSVAPFERPEEGGFSLRPNEHRHLVTNVYFPLRPELGSTLRGRIGMAPVPRGDGADVEIELIAPGGNPLKNQLAAFTVERNQPPTEIEIPLDPWAAGNVLLRLSSDGREDSEYDRVRVFELSVTSDGEPATIGGALRVDRAWAEESNPRLEAANIFLHPNPREQPQARILLPMRPSFDSCFRTGVRHAGTEGDGVHFGVSIREAGQIASILREHVRPGQGRDELPGLSLAAWAGRDVDLILSTAPGETTAFDWAYFLNPRVERGECGLTQSLVTMLNRDQGQTRRGDFSADGQALRALVDGDAAIAEVVFPIQPEEGTCVRATLQHHGGAARAKVTVEDASGREVILRQRLEEEQDVTPDAIPLRRWAGRPIRLLLSAATLDGQMSIVRFDGPVLSDCP